MQASYLRHRRRLCILGASIPWEHNQHHQSSSHPWVRLPVPWREWPWTVHSQA
ncbi:hypothetical protein LINGRAHAP2_LOCUS2072 [Linum grandiflorum]